MSSMKKSIKELENKFTTIVEKKLIESSNNLDVVIENENLAKPLSSGITTDEVQKILSEI